MTIKGGSCASEAVLGFLDVGAFERVEFLMSGGGGRRGGSQRGGGHLPPMSVALASADPPSLLSGSILLHMQESMSQLPPLSTTMTAPNDMFTAFSPALTGGKKRRAKK